MAEILSQMPNFPKDKPDESGILFVEVCDDTHVSIQAGQVEGPLSGGGRNLGFIKTRNGWKFDQRSRNASWCS